MRLIDADALKKAIANHTFWTIPGIVYRIIDSQPTVDAEPVRHGRMVDSKNSYYYECTCCGAKVDKTVTIKFDYCYHCGARMDGGSDENHTDDN